MHKEIGTLEPGEIHPAAHEAFKWVKNYILEQGADIFKLLEAFASCALSGNRSADICGETLRRIMNGESVSDRYLMGLCLTLKEMEKKK